MAANPLNTAKYVLNSATCNPFAQRPPAELSTAYEEASLAGCMARVEFRVRGTLRNAPHSAEKWCSPI